MTTPQGKTLAELNVQPGDVVRSDGFFTFTIKGRNDKGGWDITKPQIGIKWLVGADSIWHIVSRANPAPRTRDTIDAEIAALQAELETLP